MLRVSKDARSVFALPQMKSLIKKQAHRMIEL